MVFVLDQQHLSAIHPGVNQLSIGLENALGASTKKNLVKVKGALELFWFS